MSSRCFVLLILAACGGRPHGTAASEAPIDVPCAWPTPGTVVFSEGEASLVRHDVTDTGALFTAAQPDDPDYADFRARVRRDGAELREPVADRAPPADDAERELWRREDHNSALVMSGKAGSLRSVQCLEALAFVPERETIVLVLRKDAATRLYVGTSDQMFPPKTVYGTTQAADDVAGGWRFDVVLHNHTVRTRGAGIALGMPTLSTSDVSLFRNLVTDLGLRAAWVTNGVYTAEVPAADFPLFLGRD
ncbi:MAG TPA: hypothetical protein VM261_27665 [Kofleriaceae bacterium]|nr:hypothetical protein [Kofleriaceae bacterium]